jgi:hypothetical protein
LGEEMNVYGSDNFKKNLEDCYISVKEKSDELRIETYKNALVLPLGGTKRADGREMQGGVFDENLNLIDLSKTIAKEGDVIAGSPEHLENISNVDFINEDVVFLGFLNTHFGHFIIESLCRLYVFFDKGYSNKKAVYISSKDSPFLDILELFGLDKKKYIYQGRK